MLQHRRVVVAAAASRGGVSISPIARKQQRAARSQPGPDPSAPSTSQPPRSQPPRASSSDESYGILEAFFYGRAFARTLTKRLGDTLADTVAEVSKSAAERPQRIKAFQEEVEYLARKDMAEAAVPARERPSASGGSSAAAARVREDPKATVDDLRAEIAYTRAILQQLKALPAPGATTRAQ